jgi:dethiobiotin synthetase
MATGYFITGTDTECGKTEITLGLMRLLQGQGATVLGMKPVASGAEETAQGLRNNDAFRIQQAGSQQIPYSQVNPYLYQPAIAPHLASQQQGEEIRFQQIVDNYRQLATQADIVLVEGVGGWRVPLGPDGGVAELASTLGLPVILVVGLRLGCINHALLTAAAIRASGLQLAGWVANLIDPDMAEIEGNIATLEQHIKAPCIGKIPYIDMVTAEAIASRLSLPG